MYKHNQLQVILKPPPENVQELYLESLAAIGIDLCQHDIKFEEDNWESPTLGAWGIGWQVMLDGLEITQFTYFQQCGGLDLDPICAELTYGLERIAAFLQDVDSIYDIVWAKDPDSGAVMTYGDVRLADELQFSVYNFEAANVEFLWKHLELYESECQALLDQFAALRKKQPGQNPEGNGSNAGKADSELAHSEGHGFSRAETEIERSAALAAEVNRFPLLPAFDLCLKCSHLFNLLDARGAISVTERVGVIARIRNLAVGVAKAWTAQQQLAHELSQPEERTAYSRT